jgi:hypothetical protein
MTVNRSIIDRFDCAFLARGALLMLLSQPSLACYLFSSPRYLIGNALRHHFDMYKCPLPIL